MPGPQNLHTKGRVEISEEQECDSAQVLWCLRKKVIGWWERSSAARSSRDRISPSGQYFLFSWTEAAAGLEDSDLQR